MKQEKNKHLDKKFIGWESALHEAENRVLIAENHIRQLKQSIRIFKKKIEAGEPWPGNVEAALQAETVTQ